MGTARATRQNAAAVGPTPAARASLTKIGDSAMKVAPAKSAASAGFMARAS
jgi:hypothetical protein